jgi:hypothetical protein
VLDHGRLEPEERVTLEQEVCGRAAQVMRACAADLGLDHPWRARFQELAVAFELDAAEASGQVVRGVPAAPRLRLVN